MEFLLTSIQRSKRLVNDTRCNILVLFGTFFDATQHSSDIHNIFFIPYLLEFFDYLRYHKVYLQIFELKLDILDWYFEYKVFHCITYNGKRKATQSFKTIQIFSRLWHQLSFANNLCEAYSAKSTYDNMLRWKIITFMLYDVRSFAYIILRILPRVISDLIIIIYTPFHIDKHQHTCVLALCTLSSIAWNIYGYIDKIK